MKLGKTYKMNAVKTEASPLYCRSCLSLLPCNANENNEVIEPATIRKMYSELCEIKIDVEDDLPHTFCLVCTLTLIQFYTFRNRSNQNEEYLQQTKKKKEFSNEKVKEPQPQVRILLDDRLNHWGGDNVKVPHKPIIIKTEPDAADAPEAKPDINKTKRTHEPMICNMKTEKNDCGPTRHRPKMLRRCKKEEENCEDPDESFLIESPSVRVVCNICKETLSCVESASHINCRPPMI